MENFDFYISSNGYFVVPEYNIEYKIDPILSNIPSMPESSEIAVKVAGRDGDIPLSSTYEPLLFEIVCYTDDNLTPAEKNTEEQRINTFLNTIKSETKTMAMQFEEKFYDVKYTGKLTTERYPKHIKFTIPLKSSNPYGKNLTKSVIEGNGTLTSNTVKDVGAVFTINGPAQTPVIALNDYQMEYENVVLENYKLIIDSGNSTITLVAPSGTKTNAMRYYNHEFPKIKNGQNELKVQSGITTATQVKVEWYDLKL